MLFESTSECRRGRFLARCCFAVYVSPVADVISQHGVKSHQYADDTQLRLSMRAGNTAAGLAVLAACTADVRKWYMQNGLQLNSDKSEALVIGTTNQLHATTLPVTTVGGVAQWLW